MAGGVLLVAAWLASASPTPASACVALARPLAAGETPLAADLLDAPCAASRPAFVYDPVTGVARARRDLSAGEVVRAPPRQMLAAVRKGQSLSLRAAIGPVAIERKVVATRAAAQGRPVWVRGEDGAVFLTSAASVTP